MRAHKLAQHESSCESIMSCRTKFFFGVASARHTTLACFGTTHNSSPRVPCQVVPKKKHIKPFHFHFFKWAGHAKLLVYFFKVYVIFLDPCAFSQSQSIQKLKTKSISLIIN